MSARRGTGKDSARAAKPDLSAQVHLVYGEDEYLVSTNAKKLVDDLCPKENQDFGLEVIEAHADNAAEASAAVDACLMGLQTLGFLAGQKVVWLRDANFLGTGKTAEARETREAVDKLTALIKAGLQSGQVLVVSAPKVDGRSAFFKACKAAGSLQHFALPEKTYQLEAQARETAAAALKGEGLRVSGEVLEEFLARTGTDTRQIMSEVEKLRTYCGERDEVSVRDVREVVSASREALAWDLADAVGRRNLEGALRVLRQLLFQGENPVGLLFTLEGRFKDILLYRECLDRGWVRVYGKGRYTEVEWSHDSEADEALSSFARDPRKTHPFRAKLMVQQAQKYSAKEAARCQGIVLEAHRRLVSSRMSKELLLEFLMIRLLGRGQQVRVGK